MYVAIKFKGLEHDAAPDAQYGHKFQNDELD